MKLGEPPDGVWSHPPARAAMLDEVRRLSPGDRAKRLSVSLGKDGHVDDEVVVTLLLTAWRQGDDRDAETFAGALTKRVLKQVRAHARKNPAWKLLGGGPTVIDDLCQSIVMAILQDQARPCHAEQAFGNYVYRRCLDEAGKLYAKKHSAGQSLDDEASFEADAQDGEPVDSSAMSRSPQDLLESLEEQFKQMVQLEHIRRIVEDELPETDKIAFTFRYYGELKILSKTGEPTVTSLMGISETTATKYINRATQYIISRLKK
jgi:DNA-directed RNA polymerase specialized sigma24 family protein